MSADPYINGQRIYYIRSAVEAIATKLGVELNFYGEPAGDGDDPALAAPSVQADALIGPDQVPDVVHARHEPDVVHSRHDAPRDIPSSAGVPAASPGPLSTTPSLDRAIEELEQTDLGFEHSRRQIRPIAHRVVSAALRDRVAIREALRTADDDYQAREHEANVGRGSEPGDWWLFMVNAMAEHLLGQDDASTAAILGARGEEVDRG